MHDYRAYASTIKSKPIDEVFTSRSIDADLDPKNITVRESRDSTDNPNSTPLIVALDVTGSMGRIAEALAKEGIGTLFKQILERKPITDPHLMSMGVGDADHDRYPLQVSQFEADNRAVEQLAKLYLEGGGGGNESESYNFPWYFAANHVQHDSWAKRRKRGYLFTIGDELAPRGLTAADIAKFTTGRPQVTQTPAEMLHDAERTFCVYHIIIAQGDFARRDVNRVTHSWNEVLGQRVITLRDYNLLPETIISAIAIAEGQLAERATDGFHKLVLSAVKHLPVGRPTLALPQAT